MTKPTSDMLSNANFLAMIRGVRELHQLSAAGLEDSPEADAIRDATDQPWQGLTGTERDRVRNLSEDLYSLVEPAPPLQPMNSQAHDGINEALAAKQRGDRYIALDLLRTWRAFVDPALLSYLRGAIWMEAGDPATAALFFEHASRLKIGKENLLGLSSSEPNWNAQGPRLTVEV